MTDCQLCKDRVRLSHPVKVVGTGETVWISDAMYQKIVAVVEAAKNAPVGSISFSPLVKDHP